MLIKRILTRYSFKSHTKKRTKKYCLWQGIMLVGIFLLTTSGVGSQGPTFHSILTKDQISLAPDTRFSINDRISFQTVWTGLTGTHEEKVRWIRPNGITHEQTRLTFTIPSGNPSYSTSACCLEFPTKQMVFISAHRLSYLGTWRAQLFLDGRLLSEYSFSIY